MKKLALLCLILLQLSAQANTITFSEEGKFGLKDDKGAVVVPAEYRKLIRIGETGWLFQKGAKFGLMGNDGKVRVKPTYTKADRILGKYAKLGVRDKYGLFDEKGFAVLPVEYSMIDVLYGGMFLTCKNYKYGITDHNGQVILDNIFDDIYMPKPNVMVIEYNGNTYEISREKDEVLTLPHGLEETKQDFMVKEIINKPVATTGYYGVTATNYLLKIFSSFPNAYEQTIDELMFSQGADAATAIMKFTWLPKFPVVYVKKYYQNLTAPNNGPLSGVKSNLKKQINN